MEEEKVNSDQSYEEESDSDDVQEKNKDIVLVDKTGETEVFIPAESVESDN